VLTEDLSRIRRNDEFRFYLATVVFVAAVIMIALLFDSTTAFGFEQRVRHAVFNTISIITTTGYASTDFDLWSAAAKHVLFVCMFLGAMVGSTTCSIKTLRWLIVLKAFRRDLFLSIHEAAIRPVRISGNPIEEETIRDVYEYHFLFCTHSHRRSGRGTCRSFSFGV
jgi:trk system potassium uptake protein TrkH